MKRFIDILVSGTLLLVLFIPLIFVALIIKIESKGSIFFLQDRLGKNGNIFRVYKFRSMRIKDDRVERQVFKDHPDVTLFGQFIRRFKIDELPQLINVLIGDMSLVGPRPCLPSLKEKFDENAYFRLKVRPGLTGWAQVNGNIYNSWPKRWEYDRYYVENQSLFFDLKILILTIKVVLFGEEK
jgi:undecaprenyl phosphate N,N'-diacetylbacillosamine 1-phosphate transferase